MSDFEGVSLYEKLGKFVAIPLRLMTHGQYLTPEAKWLYATLRSFTNNKTDRTFPGYEKIIQRSGLNRNSVAKALKELEHFHWIGKTKNFGKSSDYKLYNPSWRETPEDEMV